jgi:hypothetical protein
MKRATNGELRVKLFLIKRIVNVLSAIESDGKSIKRKQVGKG